MYTLGVMLTTGPKQKDFLQKYGEINRKMEEDEAAAAAARQGLQYINLSHFPADLNAVAIFTKEQAEESGSVVFFKEGNDLKIGSVDPSGAVLKVLLKNLAEKHSYKTTVYLISKSSFEQWFKYYEKIVKPKPVESDILQVGAEENYTQAMKSLEQGPATRSATEILAIILGAASNLKASDIHFEPEEKFIKVRFRLDGILTDQLHLSKEYQKAIISRIKILSKLKLNVDNVPQDGRFSYNLEGSPSDVRVSVLPSAYGESVVMRLLATSATLLKLDDLGLTGKSYEIIKEELYKPNGMIITTGPTGSGKTTTLYAFLNQLNEPGVKIITLEDPVEYKLEGIIQTPINSASGMTFASGLRSILRQDPDVIMVGEIRDQETAETALQAALTGHVVFSTLHTNDAAGAIPRLINMGAKPFVIAPGLNAIIAQRLVRRLCPACKREVKLDPFLLEKARKLLSAIPKAAAAPIPEKLTFYGAGGCEKCGHTGYSGRIGIYEVIGRSDRLEKLIMQSAGTAEIRKVAIQDGMVTMGQDGLLKALQGITDVEEVFRVTGE